MAAGVCETAAEHSFPLFLFACLVLIVKRLALQVVALAEWHVQMQMHGTSKRYILQEQGEQGEQGHPSLASPRLRIPEPVSCQSAASRLQMTWCSRLEPHARQR